MKLLNLDELSATRRRVELFGKEFELAEKTVGQMIESISYLDETKDRTDHDVFLTMVQMARQLLPDATEEEIRRLDVRQLRALIEFANSSDEEVVEGSEEPVSDQERDEKK